MQQIHYYLIDIIEVFDLKYLAIKKKVLNNLAKAQIIHI